MKAKIIHRMGEMLMYFHAKILVAAMLQMRGSGVNGTLDRFSTFCGGAEIEFKMYGVTFTHLSRNKE